MLRRYNLLPGIRWQAKRSRSAGYRSWPATGNVKKKEPQINTDGHRYSTRGSLSVFICVHLWLNFSSMNHVLVSNARVSHCVVKPQSPNQEIEHERDTLPE